MSRELEIAEAYFHSLLLTERAPPKDLEQYQSKLLRCLVKHAIAEAPFYKDRPLPPDEFGPRSPYWLEQPFLSRNDVVREKDSIRSRRVSNSHGEMQRISTGGSTAPAAIRTLSAVEATARLLASYRMFSQWRLDQSIPFFVFRKNAQVGHEHPDRWGFAWTNASQRGERRWVDIATPPAVQIACMQPFAPIYVNTLPSNILRLSVEALRSGTKLHIPYILSVGEYLAPEVREAASRAFGSQIIDSFSSAEGGVIGIQCPLSGLYHVQSDQVLVEIIGSDGKLCGEGEVGEVVVTPLYGYAMPLLRYRSGDFVEVGSACSCGRTLPTISRIVGRKESMFDFPDGERRLPSLDRVYVTTTLTHDRWLVAQKGLNSFVFRHAGPIDLAKHNLLLRHLRSGLPKDTAIKFEEVSDLPLTSGGKRHFSVNEAI